VLRTNSHALAAGLTTIDRYGSHLRAAVRDRFQPTDNTELRALVASDLAHHQDTIRAGCDAGSLAFTAIAINDRLELPPGMLAVKFGARIESVKNAGYCVITSEQIIQESFPLKTISSKNASKNTLVRNELLCEH
jgi:hypothetical protein